MEICHPKIICLVVLLIPAFCDGKGLNVTEVKHALDTGKEIVDSIHKVSGFIYESKDVTDVAHALKTGMKIVDTLDKVTDFISTLADLADGAGEFLSGVVSIVELVMDLTGGKEESPELKYLRNLSKTINTRFDEVDAQLSDMKKLVEWSSVLAPYLAIALKVRAISSDYNKLFTVPTSVLETETQYFIKTFESGYQECGTELYLGFMEDMGSLGGNLLESAMTFYENDRAKLRSFMKALTKLLFTASQVELGYFAAKNSSDTPLDIELHRSQWEDRFKEIVKRMLAVDQEVELKWKDQYKQDINRFLLDNRNENSSYVSDSLYVQLSTKYFWRDWLVILSDHVDNQYDRNQFYEGYAHSDYGKDVVVTSLPMANSTVDKHEMGEMAQSLRQTYYDKGTRGNADLVFSWIDPTVRYNYTKHGAIGVIHSNKNTAFNARSYTDAPSHSWDCSGQHCMSCDLLNCERLDVFTLCSNYYVYFFG
ncbi:hypothetical protein FSP39_003113 [Pinctada imbricata]|uniref:Uncharacterized protein n=1 Tax=Pinctada imbricata TaxID=66713 RepID=A0AA88Y7F6_PINIB|nr:hypothetical protein FSP39_003113 [Pinctada imbricata]